MASKRRKCDQCGRSFVPRSKVQKRCSPECSRADRLAACARLNEAKRTGEFVDLARSGDIVCGCGMSYAVFRGGVSFLQQRRDIIAIGTDRKTGKTKYGRRNGVLGYMRELKQLAWRAHVDECASIAKGQVVQWGS